MASQKSLLAQLYAANQSGADQDDNIIERKDFGHHRVCKNHLDFDTHQSCDKIHSDELRASYLDARKTKFFDFETRFLDDMSRLLHKATRILESNKKRENSDTSIKIPDSVMQDPEVVALSHEVAMVLDEANDAALESDDVTRVSSLMARAEELAQRRQRLIHAKAGLDEEGKTATAVQQFLRVCDVCGSLLSESDPVKRLLEHYKGKQHKGMYDVRESVKKAEAYLADPETANLPRSQGVRPPRPAVRGRGGFHGGRSDRREDRFRDERFDGPSSSSASYGQRREENRMRDSGSHVRDERFARDDRFDDRRDDRYRDDRRRDDRYRDDRYRDDRYKDDRFRDDSRRDDRYNRDNRYKDDHYDDRRDDRYRDDRRDSWRESSRSAEEKQDNWRGRSPRRERSRERQEASGAYDDL